MKKIVTSLVVFVVIITHAQNKVVKNYDNNIKKSTAKSVFSGYVKDKKGEPLYGATIFIHDIKKSILSDKSGYFNAPSIPVGKYLVEISFIGYASFSETIDLNKDFKINVVLEESVANHDEVTVTGVASASKLKFTSQPITIVKKTELLQTTSTNIIEALSKRVPGVTALTTSPAVAKPIIRGLGYNRVVVINDGVRQEGQQWGDEHGIEIDENSVQKIEVLKGAASLIYGSDAMAGVVNIISNTPTEQGFVKGNIGYQFLDNNGLQNVYGNIAGNLNNGLNWNLYSSNKSAKDYENKYDGRVFNSRFKENNFGGYIGINKTWGYSHLLVSNFNQKLGLVEGERDAITGRFLIFSGTPDEREVTNTELNGKNFNTPYQHVQHFKISSDNNIAVGTGRLNVNLGFQRNQRKEFGDYTEPTKPELYFDLSTITYNAQFHFKEKNNWKTSVGASGMQQQNKNKAQEVLIPEYNQTDVGFFLFTKKTFTKITFNAGARYDVRTLNSKAFSEGAAVKFTAFNRSFSNISASAGISYAASQSFTLKANIARGFRAPTVAELASNGIHEGTERYEFGDNNLKSESSLQFDLGFEYNTQHFNFSTNLFLNSINNYIYYSKLASKLGGDSIVITPDGPAEAFKFRQGNTNLYGFEVKLDIHPHPLDWLHFENSFSLVAGRFQQAVDGAKNLPFMPAPRWQSELRADIKKVGNIFSNFYTKFELDNVLKQNNIFTAYNTETATNGYSLINFGIGTDIVSKKNKIASIYLAINNIADIAYQNHLSRLKYTATNNATGRDGVFNMGRNFSAKLVIPLSFKVK